MLFPVPDGATLSTMMQSARKKLRLSQRQVAEKAGMSQQNYARIEKNPGIVGFDTVLLVLAALGLDMQIDDRRHTHLPVGGLNTKNIDALGFNSHKSSFSNIVSRKYRPAQNATSAAESVPTKAKAKKSWKLPPSTIWNDGTLEEF